MLREAIGVTPSEDIAIQAPESDPQPAELSASAARLVEIAGQNRPDLKDLAERLHAFNAEFDAARAENRPRLPSGLRRAMERWAMPIRRPGA
jgi:outer membrane protein TolC